MYWCPDFNRRPLCDSGPSPCTTSSKTTTWRLSSRVKTATASSSTSLILRVTLTSPLRSPLPSGWLTEPWWWWTVSQVIAQCFTSLPPPSHTCPSHAQPLASSARRVCTDGDRAAAGHRWAHQTGSDDEQDGPRSARAAAEARWALPDLPAYRGERQRHHLHLWRGRGRTHGKHHGTARAPQTHTCALIQLEFKETAFYLWLQRRMDSSLSDWPYHRHGRVRLWPPRLGIHPKAVCWDVRGEVCF